MRIDVVVQPREISVHFSNYLKSHVLKKTHSAHIVSIQLKFMILYDYSDICSTGHCKTVTDILPSKMQQSSRLIADFI